MKIGPYEVTGELGRGAMGVVYRVRGADGRDAALKLVRGIDEQTFARFDRERRLLESLGESQGFVTLLEAGQSREGAWLVMPLVAGGTLRKRLEKGPLGVDETVSLGIALARALGAAHERGIIHRDVKPENVLFTASGHPLVADLGLAKHFDRLGPGGSQSVSLTQEGVLKGTAGYAAPEQLEDAANAGPPSDVFAVGAILYECLAGHPAFPGRSVLDVIGRVGEGRIERIGRKDVPAWLDAIVRRSLDPDPRARFESASALASALEKRMATRQPRLRLAVLLGLVVLALGAAVAWRWSGPSARKLLEIGRERRQRGELDAAIRDLSRAIELDPELAPAWTLRGWAREEKDDLDGTILDETRAIELDGRAALAWACRGTARARKGDLNGGIADETKAIELDPALARAWSSRGWARLQTRDFEPAIADLSRALELDPDMPRTWVSRGYARGERGDWVGAIADDTEAIARDPRYTTAWVNRGRAHGEKGDWDEAIADQTRAIELDPKLAAAWVDRGHARGQKGDWDGEIDDETRAIELDPRLPQAWINRGLARGTKGDIDGKIADETRAIEVAPTNAVGWLNRSHSRGEKGDWAGKEADATRALELDPKLAPAWRSRGTARSSLGDFPGAIADLERSLELESEGPQADRARRLIEEARSNLR